MNGKARAAVIIVIVWAIQFHGKGQELLREWKLPGGAGMIRAELVLVTGPTAVLLTPDFRQLRVPIASMSEAEAEVAERFHRRIADLKRPLKIPAEKPKASIRDGFSKGNPPHLPDTRYRAEFSGDRPNGLAQYRVADGLCYVETYRNGLLHGLKVKFYPKGNVYSMMSFESGSVKDKDLTFYEDGTIKRIFHWKDGMHSGPAVSYFQSGRLADVYPLVEGMKHGRSRHYTAEGLLYGIQAWHLGEQVDVRVVSEINASEYQKIAGLNERSFAAIWYR